MGDVGLYVVLFLLFVAAPLLITFIFRKCCDCYNVADFRRIGPSDLSFKYKCNNCNKSHYSPLYREDGYSYMNPDMEKYFYNQAKKNFTNEIKKEVFGK